MKNYLYLCTLFWISMRTIVIVIVLVGLAIVLLSVGVILRKDHSFRSQHIHQNERMKQDKIHCAKTMDREEERKSERKINVRDL